MINTYIVLQISARNVSQVNFSTSKGNNIQEVPVKVHQRTWSRILDLGSSTVEQGIDTWISKICRGF